MLHLLSYDYPMIVFFIYEK